MSESIKCYQLLLLYIYFKLCDINFNLSLFYLYIYLYYDVGSFISNNEINKKEEETAGNLNWNSIYRQNRTVVNLNNFNIYERQQNDQIAVFEH